MVASPDHSVEAFQVGEVQDPSVEAFQVGEVQNLSVEAFQALEGPCRQAGEAFLAPDCGDH